MLYKIGYKRHLVIVGVDQKRLDLINKLKQTLKERYDRLLEEQNDIEKFINSIENSKLRKIFEYRYIDSMDWYKIATVLGFSGESVPRMRHDRYIEKYLKD